jgi:hypothetical protein
MVETMQIVDLLRTAANNRSSNGIWFKPLCDSLADILERAVKKTNVKNFK